MTGFITYFLCTINICLALALAIPCLMAGVMSMDSPQAQSSYLAHAICGIILSYPLVCLICGIMPLIIKAKYEIFIAILPLTEAIIFVIVISVLEYINTH